MREQMLTYRMDERGGLTKTAFLYESVKRDILSGEIRAGEALPAKRKLALHLGISVLTVENVYGALEEEGYITARERSGYYVKKLLLTGTIPGVKRKMIYLEEEKDVPDADTESYFPAMARLMRKILSEQPEILSRKPPHLGCAVLRNAIAGYLRRYRGMDVLPSQIIIGSGAEYLYGLIVQLLGRSLVYGTEDPGYEKIAQVYRAHGAEVELLPLLEDGIPTESLRESRAGVLHITPFHSWPTMISVTAEKRYEYLNWAEERGAYLVEDDFDSEFSSIRKPVETLFSMDGGARVIYVNTFSKSIAPSMRIGYMILPEPLLEDYRNKLGFYSCTVPVFDQYVLAAFIREGSFERHLNRKRRKLKTGRENGQNTEIQGPEDG